MATLQQAITDYYLHLEDATYVESLLTQNSEAVVFNTLLEGLNSPDEQMVGRTSLFIRDVALLPHKGTVAQHFTRQYIYSPALIHQAEALLFSPNHFIRTHSVYLLAKLCSYSSLKEVQRAFNTYLETDPLLVARLIFELQWLKAKNYWSLLHQTASSQRYLTRWAGLSTLRDFGGLKRHQVQTYLQALARDPHPLVKDQAAFELMALNRVKKAFSGLAFSWDDVEIRFGNHLYQQGRTQYTVEELDQFVQMLFSGPK